MAVFNFDSGTGNAVDTGGNTATATGTLTDDGVSFTFSVIATSFGTVRAAFDDAAGPGVAFSAISTGAFPTQVAIEFALASTTPGRTAFETSSNPVIQGDFGSIAGTVLGGGSSIRFRLSDPSSLFYQLNTLAVNFTCYCAGTRIATVDGSKPVEDLEPGDRLRLADGGVTVVKWLGKQSVSKTFADPLRVNPICIKAGVLGNERDLYVSPDHGVVVDGYLVNASALVNGGTIYQVREMPEDWTYYHIETEAHEVILAEGIPTESYVDMPSRAVFDNGDERADAPRIEPMDLPRISSARLVPDHLKTRCRPAIAAE